MGELRGTRLEQVEEETAGEDQERLGWGAEGAS